MVQWRILQADSVLGILFTKTDGSVTILKNKDSYDIELDVTVSDGIDLSQHSFVMELYNCQSESLSLVAIVFFLFFLLFCFVRILCCFFLYLGGCVCGEIGTWK